MFKRHVFLRTFHNYSVASAFIHCQLRMSSSVSCCTRPLFSKCTKLTCDKFMVLPSLCSASSDCPSVLRLCAHLGYHVLTVFRAGAMGLIIMFFFGFQSMQVQQTFEIVYMFSVVDMVHICLSLTLLRLMFVSLLIHFFSIDLDFGFNFSLHLFLATSLFRVCTGLLFRYFIFT